MTSRGLIVLLRDTRLFIPMWPECAQEEGKPLKAAKVPKVKRPGTAYALFVKEKYTSISDTFPAGERSVSVVRLIVCA